MQGISEADFTAAMESAVARRGADWIYPPRGTDGYWIGHYATYSDAADNPTCLIGVVMHELGLGVPSMFDSRSAVGVLKGLAEVKVRIAARCAQLHQDRRKTWGEALRVYRMALIMVELMEEQGDPVEDHHVNEVYYSAVAEVEGKDRGTAMFEAMQAQVPLADLYPAMKTVAAETNSLVAEMNSLTAGFVSKADTFFQSNATVVTGITYTFNMNPISPQSAKKDHALVA